MSVFRIAAKNHLTFPGGGVGAGQMRTFLSVPIQDNQELIAFLIPDYKGICTLVFLNTEHNSDTS